MNKEELIMRTIRLEGGYVNNVSDPGGETKYGISKRQYPTLDIQNLTEQEALEIYKRDYWDDRLDLLFSHQVRGKVFDMGVNMGKQTAIKILQDCVGAKEDGVMGQETANLANAMNEFDLIGVLRKAQLTKYASIITRNTAQVVFLMGWINRTFAT